MPRKLYSVTLYVKEEPMFKISHRGNGPFITELLQTDHSNAIAFMCALGIEFHSLLIGKTLLLTNFNDETTIRLLIQKLYQYVESFSTGQAQDAFANFYNSQEKSDNNTDVREDHDLEDLLMKLNFPRTTNPMRDSNNEYRSYTSSAYMRSDLAIPVMSSLPKIPVEELVASPELGTDSLFINPEQVINNERDLAPPAPITFQYQPVPAAPTIPSLRDMSVADLIASTDLSTEAMTRNIFTNVRTEHINDTTANVSSTLKPRK